MFGMFTPKASTRKRETLDDLEEGFQRTLIQLNDVDNPPDDAERATLTKALQYYITEMKNRAEKLEELQQQQVQATVQTPSVGTTTNVNTTTTAGTTTNVGIGTVTASAPVITTNTAPATAGNPANVPMTPINAPVTNYLPFQATATAPFMQNTPSKTPTNLKTLQDDFDLSNLNPNDLSDRQGGTVLNKRVDHVQFDNKHKMEFYKKFISGLLKGKGYKNVHVEDLMTVKENDTAILAAVDIFRINEQLRNKFMLSDSLDMFRIRIFGVSGDIKDVVDVKDVFKDWMTLTPEEILKSCDCFVLYNKDKSWKDDLFWSVETILNSIEDDSLRQKVQAQLDGYEEFHRFGPLALFLTLHEIAFCDSDTVDNLASALLKIKLSNFPNENTSQHASVWLKMIGFLSIFNKVPVQARTALLKQYDQSSIYAFRSYFTTLTYMKDRRLDTIASILKEGTDHEKRLKTAGKWNPTKKGGSVFATKEVKGKEIKQEEAKQDKKGGKKPTHDRSGNPIDRHPPKVNENHERVNKLTKRTEYWCGNPKCSRWGHHLMKDHTAWWDKIKEARKGRKKDKEPKTDEVKTEEAIGGALKVPRGNFLEQCSDQNF